MLTFKALETVEQTAGIYTSKIIEKQIADIPEGKVLVKVEYSSLNIKMHCQPKETKVSQKSTLILLELMHQEQLKFPRLRSGRAEIRS